MTDTADLTLNDLRHICASREALHSEMRAFLNRPGLAEMSALGRHVSDASQNVELDRIKERLGRIEQRLELTDR